MNTTELQNAFQEWHRLARAEGEAIRAANWPLVADCQNALQQLQPRIVRCVEAIRLASARPGVDTQSNESIRSLLAGLIEIENQNSALLHSMRESLQTQLQQVEHSGHTLRQIQRLYAPPRPPAWSSFS
jgi:hypothetical protein